VQNEANSNISYLRMVAKKGLATEPRAERKGDAANPKADAAMTKPLRPNKSQSGHDENTLLQQSLIL